MTDDQRLRSLLTLAAELPDNVQPPVGHLLGRSRRRRKVRAACSVLGAAAVAAAAFTLTPVVRSLGHSPSRPKISSGLFPPTPARQHPGPTAAQLSRYHWSPLPPSPLGAQGEPFLAWTGKYLIELDRRTGSTTDEGAAFDPAAGRWHAIPPVGGGIGARTAVGVWTGRQLFVTNGRSGSCLTAFPADPVPGPCLRHAALYDPAARRWTTTVLPRQMAGLGLTSAAWTGRDVILAGVNVTHRRLGVAAFDPATGRWRMITPGLPSSHPPVGLAMTATSTRVLLWSLWSRTKKVSKNGYAVYSGIDVLALGRRGTRSTVTGAWPQHTVTQNPSYANGQILLPPGQIWCGLCSHPASDSPAKLADASTLSLTDLPPGPLVQHADIQPPIWLWNGSTALAANVTIPHSSDPAGTPRAWISQLAAFDPPSNTWHSLPPPPRAPIAANPLWAGPDLLLLTATGGLLAFHA